MANPLATVVLNNIAKRSGKVEKRNDHSINKNTVNLSSKEEDLLVLLINKKRKINKKNTTLKNNTYSNNNKTVKKLKLEDLVGKNSKSEIKFTSNTKRSNTMMTLKDLAVKVKKNTEKKDTKIEEAQPSKKSSNFVKKGVTNNLENYIPKVTLDSIGKKGSLR